MSNTRLYLFAAILGGVPQTPRLIDATTAAAARNYGTKDIISVKPASPKEVAALMKAGVVVEVANETPAEQQQLPGTGDSDGTTGGQGLGTMPDLPSANLTGDGGSTDRPNDEHDDLTPGADSTDRPAASDKPRRRRLVGA